MVGGVFFAGGTYGCYQEGGDAIGQCAGCNASDSCLDIGCSQALVAQNRTPCCQYCCPEGFTEQHYAEHPEDYPAHPPVFLVQHSTIEENADSCAAQNYHSEMVLRGGDSTLVLIPPAQERCFCLGNPGVAADADSPYVGTCGPLSTGFLPGIGNTSCTVPKNAGARYASFGPRLSECQEMGPGAGERCIVHTMGFGGMVLPLVEFVIRVTHIEPLS